MLAEGATRRRTASPLVSAVLAVERAGQRPRGLATLFALPAALAAVDPVLATPPGVGQDPGAGRALDAPPRQVGEVVGDAVIETLAARLRRHLTAALPAPRS